MTPYKGGSKRTTMHNISNWYKRQVITIRPEGIPPTVVLEQVLKRYKEHSYHVGAWFPQTIETPPESPVGFSSHIVREVNATTDGGLSVSFDFVHYPRGVVLMEEYFDNEFKLVPVLDRDGINIRRFDVTKEN